VPAVASAALVARSLRYTPPNPLVEIAMDMVTWLIVGLVAGVLASLVVGGVGLVGNIVVGIVGAFVGGWIFRQLGVSTPLPGLGGVIFTAFIGAMVTLLLLHFLGGRRRTAP
jgi:uncharacterized membrane protein YeaQ/YmgE (transglycosylase-associated protein family)